MTSPDLTAANIDKLAEMFPSVITETIEGEGDDKVVKRAVNFDLLRQELSDHIVEGPQERYQLDWPGKRAAAFAANTPIAKTLRPSREESVDFDTTQNLFIEGDNLAALKLLQEPYLGKIKLIYIDPPYNTGNDFIYADDFAETTAEYLTRSGQSDSSGARLVTNLESNGRFHSDWLSMMYPRLKLARNLLSEQGFIFVSINDAELPRLVSIMNEIFGSKNHVETFIWESIFRPSNMSRRVRSNAEYVVCFARDARRDFEFVERLEDPQGDASLTQLNNAERSLRFPAGYVVTGLPDGVYPQGWRDGVLVETDLLVDDGKVVNEFSLRGQFKWQQDYLDEEISKGVLLQIKTDAFIPYYRKVYKQTALRPKKILPRDLVGDVLQANAEVANLLGAKVFDYPKPTSLIHFLLKMCDVKDNDLVLDFFAGSATTAHAVLKANAEDRGARRFIMVQLGETIVSDLEGGRAFSTIAEVSRERIRRAAEKISKEAPSDEKVLDLGFRALRVDSVSLKPVRRAPAEYDQSELDLYVDNVEADRTGLDLLFQVLLDWGLELTMSISVEQIGESEIFVVEDDALIACFDAEVSLELVRAIAKREPLRAVFRDSGFASDDARINAEQIFREISPSTDVKAL
jgi:adenine-specific DNA-methyltransferase